MENGKVWQMAYSWPETKIVNGKDKDRIAYETNRLYAFTVAPAEVKEFVFPRLDISEAYRADRIITVDVQMTKEYLAICDEGDRWKFKGLHGQEGQNAVVNVMTTALVDNGGAFQLTEHHFPYEIPFNYKVHLLCKAGREYFVRPLDYNQLQHCVANSFRRPKRAAETMTIRPTTYHEIKRKPNSPSLKVQVLPSAPNQIPDCFPYSVIALDFSRTP